MRVHKGVNLIDMKKDSRFEDKSSAGKSYPQSNFERIIGCHCMKNDIFGNRKHHRKAKRIVWSYSNLFAN